ncbi:sentrin-specific protease 8 isoform X2 [Drosophila hydei]|uniref:Sentrin-specific protease 8 isoform X2 n=1 Tax=Drosophila hydei TaxID=7224 RepID=A0A6J1LTE7_DROHY|nr:sentrin-specific protease 8 isoform X2 [Drosophila hydei]
MSMLTMRATANLMTKVQTRRYKMQSDLHFLSPTIAYSMRHLEVRERRRLVQGLQLGSKPFVFVPLVENSHWSLLLIARPDRKFYYFDSENNRNMNLARMVVENLRVTLSAVDFTLTVGHCLQQITDHEHDSGLHFMCMTDNLADYVTRCGYATSTLLISVQEVRAKRSSLLHLIRTLGGIIPMPDTKSPSLEL